MSVMRCLHEEIVAAIGRATGCADRSLRRSYHVNIHAIVASISRRDQRVVIMWIFINCCLRPSCISLITRFQISDYFIHLNLPKFNHFSYHLVIFPIAAIDRRDRSPRVNIVLATTDIEERWRIRSTLEVCGNDFLVPIPFPLPSNHSHSITTHSHSNTAFPFPFFPSPLFLLPPIPVPISSSDIYRLS